RSKRRRKERIAGGRARRVGRNRKYFSGVFPVRPAETRSDRIGMLAARQSQGVVDRRDEVTARGIRLIDERNGGTRVHSVGERQIRADAQGNTVECIVGTIGRRSVRIAAVLHSVAKLI